MKHKITILATAMLLSLSMPAQVRYVKLTCYHPVKSECDNNPLITADGSRINLSKLKQNKLKWCAVSRELLALFPKDKPKRLWIEGYGVYEVRDITSRRIKNTVDILLHPSNKSSIYHKKVKVKVIQ